ncbi:MAG: DUF2096 family protein [Candidatus Jordarchaeum sp.]|uniref:DUF2096 family protein n=1 Tax=Candidatus Jordarchaeum sp. TaxID=2823881 RepID=UPI00404ADD19
MENLLALENEWYVLNDMLGDIKSKKIEVPARISENLRYTRFIITHYKETPEGETHTHEDYLMDLEVALNNVKTVLLAKAQELGEDYAARWKKKIDDAPLTPPPQRKKTFVKGISRDSEQDFVRIRVNRVAPESELVQIAKKYKVSVNLEEEKIVIVSGARGNVKKAVREIAKKYFKI